MLYPSFAFDILIILETKNNVNVRFTIPELGV